MKKIHRVSAMLMAAIMALSLITTAFAEPIIDPGKKASFSIYKYDITTAGNDGAWNVESYVSTGLHDDTVIDKLNEREKPVVFLLWGSNAKAKRQRITAPQHLVLTAAHPSPLSAYNGFFGCRHFSKTNAFLVEHGIEPVDWRIDPA